LQVKQGNGQAVQVAGFVELKYYEVVQIQIPLTKVKVGEQSEHVVDVKNGAQVKHPILTPFVKHYIA